MSRFSANLVSIRAPHRSHISSSNLSLHRHRLEFSVSKFSRGFGVGGDAVAEHDQVDVAWDSNIIQLAAQTPHVDHTVATSNPTRSTRGGLIPSSGCVCEKGPSMALHWIQEASNIGFRMGMDLQRKVDWFYKLIPPPFSILYFYFNFITFNTFLGFNLV